MVSYPPLAPIRRVDSPETFQDVLTESDAKPVVLFKHSTACSLSARARAEMARLTAEGDPAVFEIIVQQNRTLSAAVADTLRVRHESPQVIILHRRHPVFHASHHRVTTETVRDAVR